MHKGYEIYCHDTKLCFIESVLDSELPDNVIFDEEKDGMRLLVMKIFCSSHTKPYETVLWGSGSTCAFV